MKEQTAVELVKQLFFTYAESAWYNDEDSWTISNTDFEQIINQALKVERDRITEAKNLRIADVSSMYCGCQQSQCYLMNGSYICATCNRPIGK